MHATKETAVIALGSIVVAGALTGVDERRRGERVPPMGSVVRGRDALLGLLAAVVVSAVLYSSFLTHPGGVVDSLRSYWIWLGRAGGGSIHAHPWDYYLRLLIHFPAEGTPVWSEGLILLLAAAGAVAGWSRTGRPGRGPEGPPLPVSLHPRDGRRLRGDPLQDPLVPPRVSSTG